MRCINLSLAASRTARARHALHAQPSLSTSFPTSTSYLPTCFLCFLCLRLPAYFCFSTYLCLPLPACFFTYLYLPLLLYLPLPFFASLPTSISTCLVLALAGSRK